MVELILAGVIIGAVVAAAAVTGVRDRRRRRAEHDEARAAGLTYGEPIPSGWASVGCDGGTVAGGDCAGGGGDG